WFDGNAEEAVELYTSLFPRSRVTQVTRWGKGAPAPEGSVMTVAFRAGRPELHRPQRRPPLQVHARHLAARVVRIARRGGFPLATHSRHRRQAEPLRLDRRPLRPLVA